MSFQESKRQRVNPQSKAKNQHRDITGFTARDPSISLGVPWVTQPREEDVHAEEAEPHQGRISR